TSQRHESVGTTDAATGRRGGARAGPIARRSPHPPPGPGAPFRQGGSGASCAPGVWPHPRPGIGPVPFRRSDVPESVTFERRFRLHARRYQRPPPPPPAPPPTPPPPNPAPTPPPD